MLTTPQVAIDALQSERMLQQSELRIFWEEKGSSLGEIISLPMREANLLTDLIHPAENSIPNYTQPLINYIKVEGDGCAIFSHDCTTTLDRLTEVNIFHFPDSLDMELTIHHDIWFPYAFDGSPHPQAYEQNARRLTSVLQQIESALGQATEPGDRTFFGQPGKFGMLPPEDDLIIDGRRIEVTDISNVGWSFQNILCK